MMKVGRIGNGERFVLQDRGGVWEKRGYTDKGVRATCVFGDRDVYGTEAYIDAYAYCYVVPNDSPELITKDVSSGIRVRIIDDVSEEMISEIINASTAHVAAMASIEKIRLTPKGKRSAVIYNVSEFNYDMDENTFYLGIIPEKEGGEDEYGQDRNQVGEPQGRNSDPVPPIDRKMWPEDISGNGTPPGNSPPDSPPQGESGPAQSV
jgi:PHD/YefM family antitoxin component YafN of YafNO toxin-antitoxin module